mgnify:CR=1 FL=1
MFHVPIVLSHKNNEFPSLCQISTFGMNNKIDYVRKQIIPIGAHINKAPQLQITFYSKAYPLYEQDLMTRWVPHPSQDTYC